MNLFFPLLEIFVIACMLHYLLSFLWDTKSMDLVLGCTAFLFIFGASSWLNLPILLKIMVFVGNIAPLALIVIFQPELRIALSKLHIRGRRSREITEFDHFIEQLSSAVYHMSEKQIGALIALEKEDSLEEYAQKAVLLNAQFSPALLETIFSINTPLHDGAVILRQRTLLAASAIFPLAEDPSESSKTMIGTRHRAALGLSRLTDALIIVVSEETGKVSISREGILTRGVRSDRFKGIVRSIFAPELKRKSDTELHTLNKLRIRLGL